MLRGKGAPRGSPGIHPACSAMIPPALHVAPRTTSLRRQELGSKDSKLLPLDTLSSL